MNVDRINTSTFDPVDSKNYNDIQKIQEKLFEKIEELNSYDFIPDEKRSRLNIEITELKIQYVTAKM